MQSSARFLLLKMTTIAAIKALVKEIGTLPNTLSASVPKASKDDKIWSVMNTEEHETPQETFNRWFDVMFAAILMVGCPESWKRIKYVHTNLYS